MANSLSRSVALMFFLALALPTTVLAQPKETADLNGVVLDASGKPAPGYPMRVSTTQWGEVMMPPTEDDGRFALNGLPPGTYEFRVFNPGGSPDKPIASKQITVAAGQAQKIEIRLGARISAGAGASKSVAGLAAAGGALGGTGVNWTAIQIAAVVLAAAFLVVYFLRSQRRPA